MQKTIEHVDEIFHLLKEELKNTKFPAVSHPQWEKINKTPFTTLISCILSLRTKDEITEQASYRLLKKYNTPDQLLKAPGEEIQQLIYPVGFYRTKAKTIKNISKTLLEQYNGRVPDSFDELLKLKGVGRKTAAIVMVYGHNNSNYIPVDIHVHIISNRIGWVKSKNPDETMDELMNVIPKKYWADINHLFVQFGQSICMTVSPWCSRCPIERYCKKIGVNIHR
jgi:endonuclease-3